MLNARLPAKENIINNTTPGFSSLNFIIKNDINKSMKIASPIKTKAI